LRYTLSIGLLQSYTRLVTLAAAIDRWGDYPTWIAAIGSFALVLSAVWAALMAKRLYKVEVVRDQVSRDREIRSQAAFIWGWVLADPLQVPSNSTEHLYIPSVEAVVYNRSELPIYNVNITWRLVNQFPNIDGLMMLDVALRTGSADLIYPNSEYHFRVPEKLIYYPNSPTITDLTPQTQYSAQIESQRSASQFRIVIGFTDSAGVKWTRDEFGNLERKE
jgi:hypothetical protein